MSINLVKMGLKLGKTILTRKLGSPRTEIGLEREHLTLMAFQPSTRLFLPLCSSLKDFARFCFRTQFPSSMIFGYPWNHSHIVNGRCWATHLHSSCFISEGREMRFCTTIFKVPDLIDIKHKFLSSTTKGEATKLSRNNFSALKLRNSDSDQSGGSFLLFTQKVNKTREHKFNCFWGCFHGLVESANNDEEIINP